MRKSRSPHVLNVSSNLVGFCFLVITSLRFFDKSESTVIDEMSCISMVLFMAASISSFLSLYKSSKRSVILERVASILFLAGLVLLFITTMLFSFRLIR